MTATQTDAIMALADRYAFHIPGSQHSDEARAVLLAALQEQAREGEAVANSAILARGRFHAFKGEYGEPDDWEWFEEGTNCEHGCIDAVIVRADTIAAPQPAQPDHIADTNKMVPADHVEQHLDMVEQPEQVDWKDQYEKQKRRAEMWIAKYEKDIGPLEKVYPAAQPEQGERAAFEKWIAKDGGDLSTFGSGTNIHYSNSAVNNAWTGWNARAALQSAQPVALPLTPEELDLCRQWFDSIQDTNAEYLEPSDYLLAEKLYRQLNMRVPNSISEITKSGIGGGR